MPVKLGAKIVRHGCSITFPMAEVTVSRGVFQQVLDVIAALPLAPVVSVLVGQIADAAVGTIAGLGARFATSIGRIPGARSRDRCLKTAPARRSRGALAAPSPPLSAKRADRSQGSDDTLSLRDVPRHLST